MAGRLIIEVAQPALDSNGNLINGSTLEFYDAATLAPKNVFSSSALTTSLGNVVTASGGFFPEIWAADGEAYRVVWKNASGSTLRTMDNMIAQDSASVVLFPLANIAALRAATWPTGRPLTVSLVSNWASGDGGGVYRWDATSTATDNGGTIIKEAATTTGRWVLQSQTDVNIENFDNTTVATAFTNAISATTLGQGVASNLDQTLGATVTSNYRYFSLTGLFTNASNLIGNAVAWFRRNGFPFSLKTPFGAGFLGNNEWFSSEDSTHGDSRSTVAFVREAVGSGTNGPATADIAGIFSAIKKNHLTSTVQGEINGAYVVVRQGQKGDFGGILIDTEKVGGDTDGGVAIESSVKWVNNLGVVTKRLQTIQNYAGQGSSFYGVTGQSGIGFWAEAQVGAQYAAFLADQTQTANGAVFENLIVHTKDRAVGSIIYRVTGSGETCAPDGTASAPVFSFQAASDAGMYRVAGGVGIAVGGVLGWYVASNRSLLPGADNAFPLGAAGARPTVLFAVTGTINTSDARDKTPIEPLSEKEKRVAQAVRAGIGKYQWLDAIEAKGADQARYHVGVTAQAVQAAFEAEGLDPWRYAVLCADDVTDSKGNTARRLGVRYDQLNMFLMGAI